MNMLSKYLKIASYIKMHTNFFCFIIIYSLGMNNILLNSAAIKSSLKSDERQDGFFSASH